MASIDSVINGNPATPKYWSCVETSDTLTAQIELIPARRRVLEMGPAGGHMTEALRKKGCEVIAIEMNPELAACARSLCYKLIVADIEEPEWEYELLDERFDVILLGDVLEHLKGPREVLLRLKRYLARDGYLVVSMPNVAHGSVRLALLDGAFAYQRIGLLDETHLRFFTLQTIMALFDDTGYEICDLKRIRRGIFDMEIRIDPLKVPLSVLRRLCRDPETTAYQYVFRAVPKTEAARVSVLGSRHALTERTWEPKAARTELAMAYLREGWASFWNNPPKARRMFYRAFALIPHATTLIYIAASFLPYRVLKVIDRTCGWISHHTR